ncbi:uncharacterized protein LOC136026821 [Artemia franciscana]|uniref:uncharacterized protein LOC136026821 n=1 Tax=Artemia franciscana TaxID=6661 RepID=UPI0032DAE13E
MLKTLIRKTKITYFSRRFADCGKDIKKTWYVIKEVTQPSASPRKLPKSLNVQNQLFLDKDQVRHQMTKFFAEVGKTTALGVVPSSSSRSWKQLLGPSCAKSMVLESVTEQELIIMISSLNNSSSDFHQIPAKSIKQILPSIITQLCHLINQSFKLGIFPQRLNLARVIALFKGSDREDLGNYRSISLMSVFSRIFENGYAKASAEFPGR